MMMTLLKKDWRVFRVAVIGNLLFMVAMYVLIFGSMMFDNLKYQPQDWVKQAFTSASASSILMTMGVASVYGASAFAVERRERSAILLTTLPVERGKIIASKLIVAFTVIFTFIVTNALIVWSCTPGHNFGEPTAQILGYILSWTLLSFGLAYLLSTFMESAPLSFGIAIGVMLGALFVWQFYARDFDIDPKGAAEIAAIVAFCVGIASLIGGTIYYLWRVEP